jgi:hypothetical protein
MKKASDQQQSVINNNDSINTKGLGFLSNFSSQYALSNTNNGNKTNNDLDIKVQIYFSGLITVIYLNNEKYPDLDLNQFCKIIENVCKFDQQQQFTIKWVDEEGDPCTLSSQMEFEEALRLYYLNKESELVIHVFPNKPQRAGLPCTGEDRSIYRRGARRWRKIYLVNGHQYQAKRFARTAMCRVCQDRIWGLGRQGYKCLSCKIMVHKRCHKYILSSCNPVNVLNSLTNKNHSYENSEFTNLNDIKPSVSQPDGIKVLIKDDNNNNDILKHQVKFNSLSRKKSYIKEDENNFLR